MHGLPTVAISTFAIAFAATCIALGLGGCANHHQGLNNPASVDELTRRHVAQYGALIPRPVDPAARAALEYPPPRAIAVILADIDATSAAMEEIASTDAAWKARQDEYRAMQRSRINLISELEEAEYRGDRLHELLRLKLSDLGVAVANATWVRDQYRSVRSDLVKTDPDSSLGAAARADDVMDFVHLITAARFRVHPDDFDRLAALALARRDHEEAGMLILEALHGDPNIALRGKWHDWIVANLPPTSMAHRWVITHRSFGSPIRITGQGLDGSAIDTGEWKGDVIIVDFWGMWCVPCVKAMPELHRVHQAHRDRGLRVLGILCDHEVERARAFLANKGYDWPQLIDPALTPNNRVDHYLARRYAVGGFPTVWIIDRKGVLRERVEGDLEATVLKHLDER